MGFQHVWVLTLTILGAAAQDVTYTYDKAGRLIEARYAEGKVITYTYDTLGNIVSTELSSFTYQDPNTRWISHVTRVGGGFETQVTLTNHSDQSADVTFQPYLSSGSRLPLVTVSIPGYCFQTQNIMGLFGSSEVSHFSISGSADVSVTASYRLASGLGATAHVNESSVVGTRFAMYPGEWNIVFDGLALVNRFTHTSQIEVAQMSTGKGTPKTLRKRAYAVDPYAKMLLVLDDEFEPLDDCIFRITSTQLFTPLFLRGTPPGVSPGYLYQTEPIVPGDLEHERWLPHVTPVDAVFETNIFVTNFSSSAANVRLAPFAADGTAMQSQSLSVAGNGSIILPSSAAFPNLAVSHFGIEGPQTCVVTAGYRIASGLGATAHVNEGAFEIFDPSESYEVFQGEWDRIFDGLAIVNLGSGPATIMAEQHDGQNNLLAQHNVTSDLAPNEKFLLVFDHVFDDHPGSKIRISANQLTTALFLRGTPPGITPGYLFQTLPLKHVQAPGLTIDQTAGVVNTHTAYCPQSPNCRQALEAFRVTNASQQRVQIKVTSDNPAIDADPDLVTLNPEQTRTITPQLNCANLDLSDDSENWVMTLQATFASGSEKTFPVAGTSSIGPPRTLWPDMIELIDDAVVLATPADVWGGMVSSTVPDPVGELTHRGVPGLEPRATQCPDPADISYSCSFSARLDRQGKRLRMKLDSEQLSENAIIVHAAHKAAAQTEDTHLFVVALRSDIPYSDPYWHFQFGFAFDADGDDSNNFPAGTSDGNDFFGGTDQWYLVDYDPQSGWRATVADARNGQIRGIESDAFMIIQENVIMAFIPTREFATTRPAYRTTVMIHQGDRGVNAPHEWFGDQNPSLEEPLAELYSIEPSTASGISNR